ncbi:P-loop containing nucleoside triphosphate hydrolase protein [Fomitopsis serialis]|uniref:P-loop containing nucleoside triphosphate hydrolase protein n=1 Tax=Fomitopsis serialis TaxID=139415 RepID=UPI0020079B87|nr:P-loop containing nucleoside triphosphate hydrolase protein [Neoantrodia serialis]KAH9937180.1 P-loop containing nucleoside triphosphate hydrolase protein [Neoantrodia serialis]
MRSFRWPQSLLSAQRPLLFDTRQSGRLSQCCCRLNSTTSSVVDNQGRPVYYEPPPTYLGTEERVPLDRWLQPGLVSALKEAFPAVKYATTTQRELFKAVMVGQDVMLQTPTGSGKSFSLMLAALSKERTSTDAQSITSLIIVPHRDLVYQYLRWIQRIHDVIPELGTLDSLAQTLVRGSSVSLDERLQRMRAEPPHILIGTPQALLEAYQRSPEVLMFGKLSTVVVDEVDYLLEWLPQTRDKYKKLKATRMLRKHPTPTRQLLDAIFQPVRSPVSAQKQKNFEGEVMELDESGVNRPQLVMASATFRANFRRYLLDSGGWHHQTRGWVKIANNTKDDKFIADHEDNRAVHSLGGTGIQHHVLVVSETGDVRNIHDAAVSSEGNRGAKIEEARVDGEGRKSPPVGKFASDAKKPSDNDVDTVPFSPHLLEAVAEVFALDVPRLALLVLPASAPVLEVIGELRKLGVNAQGMNVLEDEAGGTYLTQDAPEDATENPTMLVSTLATTRGLDLPSITHVFILGLPKDRPGDAYMHAAGRVGRFGRSGKVITVIEEQRLVTTRKGEKRLVDQPRILRHTLEVMGVVPTKLSHFA